jgi:hypothetical protein
VAQISIPLRKNLLSSVVKKISHNAHAEHISRAAAVVREERNLKP